MDDGASQRTYTDADIDAWVADRLIDAGQATAIRAHADRREHSSSAITSLSAEFPARQDPGIPGTASDREGTGIPRSTKGAGEHLQQIAYYIGGFTILFAFTIYVGLEWEELTKATRVAIATGTAVGLAGVGIALRRGGAPTGGNVLIFVATGLTPLVTYSLLDALGLWRGGDDANDYASFYERIDAAWLILELASIAVAVTVVGRIRFPLLTLLIAFWVYFLSLDLAEAIWADGPTDEQRSLLVAVVGLAMVVLGIDLQRRGLARYTYWFYLFGLVGVQGGFGAYALMNDSNLWAGIGFLGLSLGWIVVCAWLAEVLFLVAGAAGVYAYATYLAFEIFDGALAFIFVLAAVGLFIVLSTFAYARVIGPWLGRTFRGGDPAVA